MSRRWRNWGHTEEAWPEAVLKPRSALELQHIVRDAAAAGTTVKAVGASHSFTGIAAADGLQLDLGMLRGLVSVESARNRVTVWAGTHLWELPAILEPLGLALENMGDIDRQTVSGATQTGTHGTGVRIGGLATNIVGATLVTGTGELMTVSESENADLLPAVALGLGALGVLITVTIQCVPRFVLLAEEAPADLEYVLDSFLDTTYASDHYEFFWFPHTRQARTKQNTRLPRDTQTAPLGAISKFVDVEVANNWAFGACVAVGNVAPALTPGINRLIASLSSRRSYSEESHRVFVTSRRVRFRELEYGVPLETVPEAVRELRNLIERKNYRISFPVEVRSAAADGLLLSTAHGRETGYIAVHRYAHERGHEYFREVEAVLAAHGGRPHWGKMHSMRSADLRERYPRFDEFLGIRDRLDPERVFTNAYLTRVLGA